MIKPLQSTKTLNQEQLEAVSHGNGPLLIIAGAGTGKTTVITERIKHLIFKEKIKPSEILALTFTEKSAKEMEERIDIEMPYGYSEMWISTFHSFCDRILRNEAVHIGLNPSYSLLEETELILFLKKNIFKFNLNYFRPLGNPYKFLEGLLQHFSRLKDEDISPIQYIEWTQSQKLDDQLETKKNLELANAYKIYEELKVKEGIMDFSDLISNTLKLFRKRKNILKNYQDQFKYILVDEFQDTNFAQNELAILLSKKNENITVVGDDDQAIYRWRGAAISNMLQFKKHFPNARIITLTKNYRSTKEILDNSYKLIQNNNPDRLEIKENINKKLNSQREIKGENIEFLFASRVEDEAEIVAEKIEQLVKNHGLNFKDIAILVRANDHSQPFLRSFSRHNIPYQFLGPGHLFQQEEIKDLVAYLKVLYNFEDSSSLYRVLNMGIFNFESLEIASFLNLSKKKNISLFETLNYLLENNVEKIFINEKTKEKIKKIYGLIKKHLEFVSKETAGQILYYFLEESGLLKQIIEAKDAEIEKIAQNISRFFGKLKTYEAEHGDAGIFSVVDWIELSMQRGESPLASNSDWMENNAVNILTIHSSKGLEFRAVFLVNLVSQRFPTRERKEQIPIPNRLIKEILPEGDYHLQEERRLFYVGMTRARDFLFLTAANFYGEGKRDRKISPFVTEALGKELVEKTAMKQSSNETIQQLSFFNSHPSSHLPSPASHPSTRITYLSYSQIQTFSICPLHYKLKYLLKIPTPATSSQSFGISIHNALRDFYQKVRKSEPVEIDSIHSILGKVWINEGYANKEHEIKAFEKAKIISYDYLKNHFRKDCQIEAVEYPFSFFINSAGKQSIKVGGRIDRVDKISDKEIEIVDYKTGSNLPDEKKLEKDMQLTFYALAATEINDQIFSKKEHIYLSLYYLEEGKKFTTQRTAGQLEEAKKFILEKAKEIETSDFACSKSSFCQKCEYKMLCSTL